MLMSEYPGEQIKRVSTLGIDYQNSAARARHYASDVILYANYFIPR